MFRDAITRLFSCHFAQCDCCVGCSLSHSRTDAIYFGLRGMQEFPLCLTRLSCQRTGFLNGLKVVIKICHSLCPSEWSSRRCSSVIARRPTKHSRTTQPLESSNN